VSAVKLADVESMSDGAINSTLAALTNRGWTPDFCHKITGYAALDAVKETLSGDQPLAFASSLAGVLRCGWYQSNKLLFAKPRQQAIALIVALS
jgi:hypothetical protein